MVSGIAGHEDDPERVMRRVVIGLCLALPGTTPASWDTVPLIELFDWAEDIKAVCEKIHGGEKGI
jgi:hypothetical protein